jgi:hypothetical protein
MNTHSAHYGLSFDTLRAALHLPQRRVRFAAPAATQAAVHADWMTRLATWAERQPMHHRMGSYMQFR